METIYSNNEVEITIENVDKYEAMVNINGENLIFISLYEKEKFIKEMQDLLDKYRI